MTSRGAALLKLVGAVAVVGVLVASTSLPAMRRALQLTQAAAQGDPQLGLILGALGVYTLMTWILWRRQDHIAELGQRDRADLRAMVGERIDRISRHMGETAAAEALERGRLIERTESLVTAVAATREETSKIGSKVSDHVLARILGVEEALKDQIADLRSRHERLEEKLNATAPRRRKAT